MADNRRHEAPQGRHAANRPAPQVMRTAQGAVPRASAGGARYGYQGNIGKDKRKKSSGPWRIVFWAALVVFIGSLAALGAIGFSYFQGQNTYKELEGIAGFVPPETGDIEGTSLADMSVDWDALKAINPDTVGWIYIPGTVVNYPIVHTTDNDKYLTTDFRGGQGWLASFGTVFLSAENTADFSDANNIVYGHHMNDGSMFACISTFATADEFNSHRTVYILTPQGNYRLTTFSLVICDAYDPLAQPVFSTKDEMSSYIQDKMDRNVVVPDPNGIAAADMERIFAFVTCDYTVNDGRAVLFASVVESTVGDSQPTISDQENQGMVDPDDIATIEDATKEIE